jgi:hypothetical protein
MTFEKKIPKTNTSSKTSAKPSTKKTSTAYELPTLQEKTPKEGKDIIVEKIKELETGNKKLFVTIYDKNKIKRCNPDETLKYAYKLINVFIKTYCNLNFEKNTIDITTYHKKNYTNKEDCVFLKTPLTINDIRTGIDKKNNQNYNDNNCKEYIEEILKEFNNKFVEQLYNTPEKQNDPKNSESVETEVKKHKSPSASVEKTDDNYNKQISYTDSKTNNTPVQGFNLMSDLMSPSSTQGGKKKTRRKGRTKKKTKTRKK